MKVVLPSIGVLGTKSVDLQPVRFSDIREIQNLNPDPSLAKLEFMRRLLPGVDFNTITRWDFEYLYALTIFSVSYNTIKFDTKCPACGEELKGIEISINGMDVKQLDMHNSVAKTINGVTYEYHHMSAQGYEDALVYAAPAEDEQRAYEDAVVSLTFYGDVKHVDEVNKLPAGVYMTAFLFQQMAFHGILIKKEVECTKCAHKFTCTVDIPLETIKIDVSKLMECYASMSDFVAFSDFKDMTVPEYDNFVKSFNERYSRQS